MRKISLFILFFFSLHFSAQLLSETQKLESLCKVWGFLKYYHPHVAKGDFEWDQELLKKIDEVENIRDKDQLNELYFNWINNLGNVDECKKCSKEDKEKVYFLRNFDLNWMNDQHLFNEKVSRQLSFIQNNRNIGSNHYVGNGGKKVYFKNENSYGSKFISKQINLLELFRYWNLVEYFFPYKYQTDQNWNDVLTEMIPKFLSVNNDENYHLTLAELVTKVDDSHAFLYSSLINANLYGRRKVPVEYTYAEGKLVVTKILTNKLNEETPLKKGDVIYDVNGRTISQMVNSLGKYVPASNSWGKITKVKSLFLFSNNDSVTVKIERDGQNLSLSTKTYLLKDIVWEKPSAIQKWKFLDADQKTGYVNMGIIEKSDLDDMYRELKKAKSIIFDLRNYPKQTIFPLSRMILPEKSIYYQFNFPETDYLSKFYSAKNTIGKKNPDYYKGNVVVLADENTQSQAETTTMMFKQHPKAKVIGSNTSGANGDIIRFKIADLDTCFTGLGAYYPDGRETQRIGIIPDIVVKPTVKGILERKDEVLERALEYIKTGF
ncbi:C-terminal processing protease CtpA/Prc, contains a PDZ domain [Chryseobacterium oleae]|uniref:C-terminal processing protease CtpA/Prc, contains a PDZ domain n=1 Tax=Chryseobacterium oleae TaxID=491207 RepID=A0A1I4WES2_CHROL|nr:S41 family peptidase [Chryseobacterium oleae]SFN11716.1 C-terminal processing protease CtpA/Prc, contains a PDZ domain [Chryseobacterium oleae]